MLNKEECLEVLETLKNVTCMGKNVYGSIVNHPYDKSVDCFEQLINEHFDNPPLKFEDLKDNMVIWDNKEKMFIKLWHIKWCDKWQYDVFGIDITEELEFEENRFFLKEVKE